MTNSAANGEDKRKDSPAAFAGLKVVEFAHVIAGPLAGTFLADLGADVIHVEPPGSGDHGRQMGPKKSGQSVWWKVLGRNKRSITLDLRRREADVAIKRLLAWADVVIVSLRFDTLKKFGLDRESIEAVNPRAIILQVSGLGAVSSDPNAPGFGKVGEARSGVVYVTGFPETAPVHTGFSHADTVTGLMGAFAISAALHRRANDRNFRGEWIDLALYESLFRLLDWQIPVYDQLNLFPERVGNRLFVSPAAIINTYLTADDDWITITSGTPKSVVNVVKILGLPPEDYQTAEAQRAAADFLDEKLRDWVKAQKTQDALDAFRAADVVASRIFSVKDILADPTYALRGNVASVDDADFGTVRMPGVIPKLANHGGAIWRTGPHVGEDNELVYRDWLGLSDDEMKALKDSDLI